LSSLQYRSPCFGLRAAEHTSGAARVAPPPPHGDRSARQHGATPRFGARARGNRPHQTECFRTPVRFPPPPCPAPLAARNRQASTSSGRAIAPESPAAVVSLLQLIAQLPLHQPLES